MQQTIGHCFIVRVSGRYVVHQQGTQKNPIFSCFSKFYPPKGSKIQIRPRNDSTQCGTRFFDVESACVAALEVPDPMRDRVTEKRKTFPSPKMAPVVGPRSNLPSTSQSGHRFLKIKVHPNLFNGSGDNREKP